MLCPGTPPGADQRAVQQDHPAARSGDLRQGAVQARGAGGQQTDDLPDPPGHGGAVYPVAASQVARPLVTAQHREHDARDLPNDMSDDLRHGHRPTTSAKSSPDSHTRPVTSNFTMHTTQ